MKLKNIFKRFTKKRIWKVAFKDCNGKTRMAKIVAKDQYSVYYEMKRIFKDVNVIAMCECEG